MDTPHTPPVISPRRSITYEITRWDLFANWMLVMFRNRLLRVFVPVALVLNGLLIVGPDLSKRSLFQNLIAIVVYLVGFLGFLAVLQAILGLANAFLFKQQGVVGQHTLEITEGGLIERTEYNETLHRWPSICRILSLCGYLFVYVGDNNSHQIPKRSFAPQEFANFEADLRAQSFPNKSR